MTRAVYRVRQHYRYTYTAPVRDIVQRLVMVPPEHHGDQRLLGHRLDVRGAEASSLRWELDRFGNRVCHILADRVQLAIDFEATYRVERVTGVAGGRRDNGDGSGRHSGHSSLADYLLPTALTAPDDRLRAAASQVAASAAGPRARAERAHAWSAGAIAYQFGITGVQTPAAMALHLGKGVCQDYAHILLSLLRLLGIPARYVSGHLLGEGAPHAWVEALFDDPDAPGGIQVVAYDPTHRRRAGMNYITVAVGRDYADIAPTSGVFSGPAAGRLSSSKQAEVVELAHAALAGEEDAA